ncbi:MAG: hypothetical protein IJZ57_05935 [Clostridia bacterium]|nr:hypothetical protein [Clostridia bacterium]
MKKLAAVLSACVIIALLAWGISIAKCEVLTDKYSDDFKNAYQSNSMISNDVEYFKVLECDDTNAKVYYFSEKSGNVLTFKKENGKWIEKDWEVVWSQTGSASGVVWPYILQFFETGL